MHLFKDSLFNLKRLQVLDLSQNKIDMQMALPIKDLVAGHHQLKNLHLRNCEIDERGIKVICQAISMSETLECLDLSNSYIRQESLPHLFEMVRKNQSLTGLIFRQIHLG